MSVVTAKRIFLAGGDERWVPFIRAASLIDGFYFHALSAAIFGFLAADAAFEPFAFQYLFAIFVVTYILDVKDFDLTNPVYFTSFDMFGKITSSIVLFAFASNEMMLFSFAMYIVMTFAFNLQLDMNTRYKVSSDSVMFHATWAGLGLLFLAAIYGMFIFERVSYRFGGGQPQIIQVKINGELARSMKLTANANDLIDAELHYKTADSEYLKIEGEMFRMPVSSIEITKLVGDK